MPALDRSLDPRNERDATFGCVGGEGTDIELTIVQRDRHRLVSELGSAVDELGRRMRDVVERVVDGVRVQLNLQHARCLLKILAAGRTSILLGTQHSLVRKQRQAAEIPENCLRPAPAGESRRPRSRRRSRFTA